MIHESNENIDPASQDQAGANQDVGDPVAQNSNGVELKKRQLLKALAKSVFLVPVTLAVLTNKAAAASQPSF